MDRVRRKSVVKLGCMPNSLGFPSKPIVPCYDASISSVAEENDVLCLVLDYSGSHSSLAGREQPICPSLDIGIALVVVGSSDGTNREST